MRVNFGGLLMFARMFLGLLDRFDPTLVTGIYAPGDEAYATCSQYARLASSSETNCVGVFRTLPEVSDFLDTPTATLSQLLDTTHPWEFSVDHGTPGTTTKPESVL